MKITFAGAAETVTGSQHLLEVNGKKILLDCGLFQGRRKESFERNRNLPFNARELDAVILSHAHIDHSGNLPSLIKAGFDGPIYTTKATGHLANVMLMDSAHIQETDAAYLNKHARVGAHGSDGRQDYQPVEPLYTQEEAALVAQYFVPLDYDKEFEPVAGVTGRLRDAGHILGSAAVCLDINEFTLGSSTTHRKFKFWYSGDIGRRKLPLLRDPVLPEQVDYLLMECTYGDQKHDDPQLAFDRLQDVTRRTLRRGGKVIIPAFAVGRTQELVYNFQLMFDSGAIPRVPVFVDSPLAVNTSGIFRQHPECFDEETQEFIRQNRHEELLGFKLLTYTHSVEESKALNDREDPMIIISASGMAETGRILHHLKNNIEKPKNTILIVGWQAPDTLGRRLAEGQAKVRIFDEYYAVRAEVEKIEGLSAHAGQDLLLEYARATRETVKQIYLVHGEEDAATALMGKLAEQGQRQVEYARLRETVEVGY